jgi:hypothetical protein
MILSDLLGSSVAKTNVLTLRLQWMPQALCQHAAKFHETKNTAPFGSCHPNRTTTSHPLWAAADPIAAASLAACAGSLQLSCIPKDVAVPQLYCTAGTLQLYCS